jgi:hypothetical protein
MSWLRHEQASVQLWVMLSMCNCGTEGLVGLRMGLELVGNRELRELHSLHHLHNLHYLPYLSDCSGLHAEAQCHVRRHAMAANA